MCNSMDKAVELQLLDPWVLGRNIFLQRGLVSSLDLESLLPAGVPHT